MFNNIEGFDYGTKGKEEGKEFRYVPRSIESIQNSEEGLDNQFDAIMASLTSGLKEEEKEKKLLEVGIKIGRYLREASEWEGKGSLDITGEVRAMAAFQGFLERELLKRGSSLIHLFREPAILQGINSEAAFIHAEHILEKIRGAQATVAYAKTLGQDPKLMFVGSEIGLDCRHAIDLVIGRGNEERLEEIDLVQVKNLLPSREEITKITMKHKAYAEALLNFESSAVGTEENDRKLENMSRDLPEHYEEKMKEFAAFYNSLMGLNAKLEATWESLAAAAESHHSDPVLFYIRLKSINASRLELVPKQFVRNMLMMVKEKVDHIELPQSVAASYSRAIRGPRHITSAEKIFSVIVADGKEVNRVALTK